MNPPIWLDRFKALRSQGLTHHECAKTLNAENFKAKQGGLITIDTLRCFEYYERKKLKLPPKPMVVSVGVKLRGKDVKRLLETFGMKERSSIKGILADLLDENLRKLLKESK